MEQKNGEIKYQKFYQMDIWQEAFSLQKEVFASTKEFPPEERYGLVQQLNNSTNSVCANIAEAHGRFYYADKMRVLYTVRGEIEETQSHLLVAKSRGYIPEDKVVDLIQHYEKLKMRVNNYITDFSNRKDGMGK